MSEKRNIKRLNLEIGHDMHFEIKKRALERGISIKKWVMRVIAEQIKKEESYK
jgi:predicted HicB family RNase H-like nuclease